jgi:phosphopantothenoylcysteine decarboxylase/phosphopantothenate--cysteine ligase
LATNLNGKRILITAGPTWVPIDRVRVISNTASGKTGILLSEVLSDQGAKVTLLLGPVGSYQINKKIRVVDFKFFDQLSSLIKKELSSKQYDSIIHSAAVSDYQPAKEYKNKLGSDNKKLTLVLKQSPKIIDSLRKLNPASYLVGFKFEPQATESILIKEARRLIKRAKLDLAVANSSRDNKYRAYLVNSNEVFGPFSSKSSMVRSLIGSLKK